MSPELSSTSITRPSTGRLQFVEDGHKFILDGSIELPSVTTLLKECGVIDTAFYTNAGADNGKRRHLITELMDKGTLDWGSVADEDFAYAQGWAEFCKDYQFEATHIEQPMFHEYFMYAGIADRLGVSGEDRVPTIVDLKTGSKLERWVELQLLLYAMMVDSETPPKLIAVHLRPGKSANYRAKEFGYDSLDVAQSIIKISAWKRRIGNE